MQRSPQCFKSLPAGHETDSFDEIAVFYAEDSGRLRCRFFCCRFVVDKREITEKLFAPTKTKSLPAIGLEMSLIHYFLWLLPSSENPGKVQKEN